MILDVGRGAAALPAPAAVAHFSLPVASEAPFRLWDAAALALREGG